MQGNHAHLAPEILATEFYDNSSQENSMSSIDVNFNFIVDYSKQPNFALGVLFLEIIAGYHRFDNDLLDSLKKWKNSISYFK